MKKTDTAYIAGLFDGEGYITISGYSKGKNAGRVYLAVGINMTNEWPLQWLKFNFGGSLKCSKHKQQNWRDAWQWQLSANKAIIFLETLYPFLKLKKPEADTAIAFQRAKNKIRYGRGHPKTAEVIAVQEAQRILIRKQKGRKDRPDLLEPRLGGNGLI